MSYIYLASPYSHPDPEIREARFDAVMAKVAEFLNRRIWVYSPIVHCHEISIVHRLPYDWTFWQGYNRAMIESAYALHVLTLDGWLESAGVQAEIRYAKSIGKWVYEVEP